MCGLYGVITKNQSKKNINAVKGLGVLMESRGDHSTGICTLRGTSYQIDKDTKPASEFFINRDINTKSWCIIGHTRYATIGEKTQENAHPFVYGDIVGSHNGSVTNYKDIGDFNVDSQAIFYLLDKYNNNYNKAFKELRGSMAVTWSNRKKLYILKHNNPIFLAQTDSSIFWCSEYDALLAVMLSIGQNVEITTLDDGQLLAIDRDLSYKIHKIEFKPEPKVEKTTKVTKWEKGSLDWNTTNTTDKQNGLFESDYNDYADGWTQEDQEEFIKEYGKELVGDPKNPCHICSQPITRLETFYMSKKTLIPYHVPCFTKNAKPSDYYEVVYVR
jgi:glucosamine 6-phosphate synthetase-like amidotransferase/phosphosugar isomerase protein